MAYLDSIPAPADFLSLSQAQILENFSQLNTQFSIDHAALTAGGATGKHAQLHLPELGVAPTTIANEGCIYTFDSGTQTEAYYREESNGDIVQLTNGGYTNTFIKAFVSFTVTPMPPTIIGTAWNVTSVTMVGTGNYYINFTNPMPDANYLVICTPHCYGRPNSNICTPDMTNCTVNSARVLMSTGLGSATDGVGCNVVVLRIA